MGHYGINGIWLYYPSMHVDMQTGLPYKLIIYSPLFSLLLFLAKFVKPNRTRHLPTKMFQTPRHPDNYFLALPRGRGGGGGSWPQKPHMQQRLQFAPNLCWPISKKRKREDLGSSS
jgi:hypothetical protein